MSFSQFSARASVLVLAFFFATLCWQRLQSPLLVLAATPSILPEWRAWLAGVTLDLPRTPGIWLMPQSKGQLVLNLGEMLGHSEQINLCEQRSLHPHSPARILPLHMANWAALQQLGLALPRNALVLPSALAQGLPALQVRGQLGADLSSLQWQLSASANSEANWLVVSDQRQVDGAGSARSFHVRQQAWLLWRPLASSSHAAQGFQYALHISSRPQLCHAPQGEGSLLELRLYQAGAQLAQRHFPVFFFPHDASAMQSTIPLGKWQITATPPAPLEDQALFAAAQSAGLLRLRATQPRQILLAPADVLATQELGQAWYSQAEFTQSNQLQPEIVRPLLQRLYRKADGQALRRQIAVFNQSQASSPSADRTSQIELLETKEQRSASLRWRLASSSASIASVRPLTSAVYSRNGDLLYQAGQSTKLATELGVQSWFARENGLLASLAKQEANAGMKAAHYLSLDSRMQAIAEQILRCQTLLQGRWQNNSCVRDASASAAPIQRFARLLALDAANGEILAAASVTQQGVPLPAWQHQGRSSDNPGSTLKLLTALALEVQAKGDPQLNSMLEGESLAQLDFLGQRWGFAMRAGCYPQPCQGQQHSIANFRQQSAIEHAKQGHFGLRHALAHSVNSWFAWLAERSDASLSPSNTGPTRRNLFADVRFFGLGGQGGIDEARPLVKQAHAMGFELGMTLDGSGGQVASNSRDFLQSSAGHFTHSRDVHQLRLNALGQGVHTTPLQMAMLAAAIGSGRQVPPRLLLGRPVAQGVSVSLRLDRVRQGMQDVVQFGTARNAFASPDLRAVRLALLAKTGTAETGVQQENSAWFVAYLPAKTIPNECRNLAFAIQVSHSHETGGAIAAPVLASFLREWQKSKHTNSC